MGGLEPVSYLAKGARVMLTVNVWTEIELCNGALGTLLDFVYAEGQKHPLLPVCILLLFDNNNNHTVPKIEDMTTSVR